MGNSIRTTSNTPTATNSTPATFKAGDAVLCPSIGNATYKLQPNGSDKNSTRLVIRIDDDSHGFYRDGRVLPNDSLPSLFHDTEANRQAVNTLHHGSTDTQSGMINLSAGKLSNIAEDIEQAVQALSDIVQTSQRKVIDTTKADDKEVIVLSSHDLSDIACDIQGAMTVLNDISTLLSLIHHQKIDDYTARSMARLTHDSTSTWAELLHSRLEGINDTLAMTTYGKGATHD